MLSKNILAIDDTLDNLITIKAVLKTKFPEYQVLTALSGEEGIKIAKKEALDLIILDIMMPKLDGFETLKILKADDVTKSIPVVLLTSIKSDPESKVKGLEFGAVAFLSKPIDINELTAHIQAVLRTKETEEVASEKSKNLEKLLDEKLSEIDYQALLLSNITESVISFDTDFIIKSWNKGAEKMYGWTANEVIGKTFQDVLKPVFLNSGYSCEILAQQNGVVNLEALHQTKDGRTIDVAKSKSPILDKNNVAIGNICIARDITRQKQSELEIKKLSEVVEQSPLSVIITDLDGKIEYVNPRFEEVSGYSFKEVIGLNPRFLNTGIPKKEEYQILWETIRSGNTWRGEFLNKKKSGELYWEEAQIKPITNANGNFVNFLAIKQDITARKKVASELVKAKERAEESDCLKSAFLANMSHEIRTPMNGILGFADLLKTPNLSGEKQQQYIKVIEKSGERMLNIINDIICISKIESGVMEVNMEESNINEQIEYIYNFFKPEVDVKGITLSFKNSLPLKEAIVKTDREKLFAILTNLVKNAIKFSEKGLIEFGYTKKGKQLEFYVKDTGIGIDNDRQAAIFERFVQADISDKNALQGAGLGLSISKAYVEMLGGKIWVESEKGKGSAFYFTLPFDVETIGKNESIIDNTDSGLESSLKMSKILIVDDDETSRWLLGDILENIDGEILYAENGLEAVEICRNNHNIDLMLMDMKMPVMDGYEATRQIRQFNKKSFIIAQTAFALEGDREKAIEAGCNEYLSKPITQNKLFSLIKERFC